jgi:hypothetical protein
MDKKAKAEVKRARRTKLKEDTDAGIAPGETETSAAETQPTQEELDGLF